MLALVFAAVPALLYDRFRAADLERQGLLLDLIRERGRLISRAIEPYLQNANGVPADQLQRELARYAGERDSLKLLLRPASRPEGHAAARCSAGACRPGTRPSGQVYGGKRRKKPRVPGPSGTY